MSCQEKIQKDLDAISEGYETKNCPRCEVTLQKKIGFNMITCNSCQHGFCWICFQPYTKHHYKNWNICGCPGNYDRRVAQGSAEGRESEIKRGR